MFDRDLLIVDKSHQRISWLTADPYHLPRGSGFPGEHFAARQERPPGDLVCITAMEWRQQVFDVRTHDTRRPRQSSRSRLHVAQNGCDTE